MNHIGDPSLFPRSTSLVAGPATSGPTRATRRTQTQWCARTRWRVELDFAGVGLDLTLWISLVMEVLSLPGYGAQLSTIPNLSSSMYWTLTSKLEWRITISMASSVRLTPNSSSWAAMQPTMAASSALLHVSPSPFELLTPAVSAPDRSSSPPIPTRSLLRLLLGTQQPSSTCSTQR